MSLNLHYPIVVHELWRPDYEAINNDYFKSPPITWEPVVIPQALLALHKDLRLVVVQKAHLHWCKLYDKVWDGCNRPP